MSRQLPFLATGVFLQIASSAAQAQAPNAGPTLDLISNTADRICGVIRDSGSASSSAAQGTVNAELRGLASRLAGAGIQGTGSITNEDYQGVLRDELGTTLLNIAACKLNVFESLQSKLIPTTKLGPPPPGPSPPTPGPSPQTLAPYVGHSIMVNFAEVETGGAPSFRTIRRHADYSIYVESVRDLTIKYHFRRDSDGFTGTRHFSIRLGDIRLGTERGFQRDNGTWSVLGNRLVARFSNIIKTLSVTLSGPSCVASVSYEHVPGKSQFVLTLFDGSTRLASALRAEELSCQIKDGSL